MDAVGLVEGRHPAHSLEQERNERDAVLPREPRIDVAEAAAVFGPVVGQGLHSHEHDLRRRRRASRAVDDRLDVVGGGRGILAAQRVVAASLHYQDRHRLGEEPFDPASRARRRFAADARVDHAVAQAGLVDLALDDRGVRLLGVQAVAGREAVAEEDDRGRVRRPRCGRRGAPAHGGRGGSGRR